MGGIDQTKSLVKLNEIWPLVSAIIEIIYCWTTEEDRPISPCRLNKNKRPRDFDALLGHLAAAKSIPAKY